MIDLTFLFAASPPGIITQAWTPGVAIVMTFFNIIGLIVARIGVQRPGVGPKLPFPLPFIGDKNFTWSQFLAGVSFGHILGAACILGLNNAGLL